MSKKYVYLFSEGNANMRELLGGKGANLAEMTNLGLPVPQGFTITTEACTQYYEDGRQINDEIMALAKPDAMVMHCLPAHREEEITAKVFEEHSAEIFEEAENRLHAQKAVMVKLMAD